MRRANKIWARGLQLHFSLQALVKLGGPIFWYSTMTSGIFSEGVAAFVKD